MSIVLNGTTGVTTPDVTSDSYTGALAVDASAPDNSVVVDASGNVGIGTSTIGSAGVSLSNSYNVGWVQGSGESLPNIFRQANSAATVVASGYRYSATSNGFASSYSPSWAKSAISLNDGTVRFYTNTAAATAAGTDVTPTERARITADGDLLIGTTSTTINSSNFGTKISPTLLHSRNVTTSAVAQFFGSSGENRILGTGAMQNTLNSYGAISDIKLKENIVDATPKLEKLNEVRIVNFNLIGSEQKQIGVIAQELEQIFPSMVDTIPDEDSEGNDLGTVTKSVKYSVFVPMLIKAIQEQQAIIDEQKTALEALTARVSALEAANV